MFSPSSSSDNSYLHISFSLLPFDSLPRLIFEKRLAVSPAKGTIPSLHQLVESLLIPDILSGGWSKISWKRYVKRLLLSSEYSAFLDSCDHLPLSNCLVRLGKPILHWMVTHGLPRLTCWNNFRIRLLVGCHSLEEDASRFAQRRPPRITPYALTCKLCGLEPEDPVHFIVRCPALVETRISMLQSSSYLTTLFLSDPDKFLGVVLGTEWIDDKPLQLLLLNFSIVFAWCTIPYCFLPTDLGYSLLVEVTKSKKKIELFYF